MRTRWSIRPLFVAGPLVAAGLVASVLPAQDTRVPATSPAVEATRWRQHDRERPRPPVVEPAQTPGGAPKDATVLFDGNQLDAWRSPGGAPARWRVVDGTLETVPGAGLIETAARFGDVQVHLEWMAPDPPHGKGQDRGNSGLFLMGQYEIQILDSFAANTYADGQAGSIYGQFPPLSNAARPPGQWQTYDVAFRRPRFDASGLLVEPARLTLFHNGVLVQNNEAAFGPTSWIKNLPYSPEPARGPIALQDHDHPVRFRNIWVRDLPDRPAPPIERSQAARPAVVSLTPEALDRYVGTYRVGDKPNPATARVDRVGDHLTMTLSFRPQPIPLLPISATEFTFPFTDGGVTFHASSGEITSAQLRVADGGPMLVRVQPGP